MHLQVQNSNLYVVTSLSTKSFISYMGGLMVLYFHEIARENTYIKALKQCHGYVCYIAIQRMKHLWLRSQGGVCLTYVTSLS